MASFTDRNGRQWQVAIVFGEIPELKRRGLDFDLDLQQQFTKLRYDLEKDADPRPLVELVWLLARKDAGTQTREEFDAGLDWEAVERAADALAEAIVDFRYRRLSARLKAPAAASPAPGPGSAVGGSPGSSESTPAASP